MIINHNMGAINTHRQMGMVKLSQSKSMEKLSSGYRINRAGDDAAGLSISEKMRGQLRGLNQATRNVQDGISFIQTAEGALTEVNDMLGRMKELAVQKANGTYNATDTANIDLEVDALVAAIGEIQNNTKFNGIDVFGTGADIAYDEAAGTKLTIATFAFTNTAALTNASTVADIDGAIDEINTQRGTYGAQQNKLEHVVNNQNTTAENLQAAESRIRDVDMAAEIMKLTKDNILMQASQSMLAQANQTPQGVLSLLR